MRIFEDLDNQSRGIFTLSSTPDSAPPTSDPMDLSRHEVKLKADWTPGDYGKAECWKYGKKGHLARDCESKKKLTSKPKDMMKPRSKDTTMSKPKDKKIQYTKRKANKKAVNCFK